MAHPVFGRSVNQPYINQARGGHIMPTTLLRAPPRIFRPCDGPAVGLWCQLCQEIPTIIKKVLPTFDTIFHTFLMYKSCRKLKLHHGVLSYIPAKFDSQFGSTFLNILWKWEIVFRNVWNFLRKYMWNWCQILIRLFAAFFELPWVFSIYRKVARFLGC